MAQIFHDMKAWLHYGDPPEMQLASRAWRRKHTSLHAGPGHRLAMPVTKCEDGGMVTGILGIDAAWTETQPSGVVLLEWSPGGRPRFVAGAPSYGSFLELPEAGMVELAHAGFPGESPDAAALLHACRRFRPDPGFEIGVVAVDMPIGPVPIGGRRDCDNGISRRFGAMGCGTHSPSAKRPGPIGEKLFREFEELGFAFANTDTRPGDVPVIMEVYPHPAVLGLLNLRHRFPYKVSKSRRYWRGTTVRERIVRLLEQFEVLLTALRQEIDDIPLFLPAASEVRFLAELKKYEDLIDALICAWVGAAYLNEKAEPVGGRDGAIWIPTSVPER
ncbi:MAG: DUF429 domain-containing protein [Candidatus Dadabacteria bacterium]|nr:MAG: DUF429 domain-containing protein [Candidatus Dadabacteria bacterium]